MTRRERERFTERARPNRKQAASRSESSDSGNSSLTNPAVLVAIAGLVIALGMAAGFMWSSNDEGTADSTDPVDESAETVADENAEEAPGEAAEEAPEEAAAPPPAPDLDLGGTYDAPEDQGLDPDTTAYFATIETPKGTIELELFPDIAPQHVNAFVFLARDGFYDGLTFHRVDAGFVIQGGDPAGTGQGGPGYNIPGEFNTENPVPHRVGTLAMARTPDVNSAGSQFYIVLADGPSATSLDGQYTVFGHVIDGMDAVLAVEIGDTMDSITISEKPIAERSISPDDIRAGNLPETIQ